MKLNLGCGSDIRKDYINVDAFAPNSDLKVDLSVLPWPWREETVDSILMLDFLEHFEYNKTTSILNEVWRILKFNGTVEIQVPDFEHCAKAAMGICPFLCNSCGYEFTENANIFNCPNCNEKMLNIINAAIHRLYGGQDRIGNYHYTAFTKNLLALQLHDVGLDVIGLLEEEHQHKNWNFKIIAKKIIPGW